MRFHLLDRVEEIGPDRIVAVKNVSQAEEYLADHFPTFPVLPGVMMLEAATQAAAWLAYRRDDYAISMAVLKAARNVRYGHFVAPGRSLRVTATYDKPVDGGHAFKVEGTVEADSKTKTAITGKLELACFRLADQDATLGGADEALVASHRARWAELTAATPSLTLFSPMSA